MPAGPSRPVAAEAELLIECARARFDPDARRRLRALLGDPIDWPRLLPLAGRHGMTPLLFLELESVPGTAVPATVLETLRARASRNTAHQLLLVAELREVLAGLTRLGIQAVPFKGPALAAALYGNVALRESRDLDLLVRGEDVGAARRFLLERGYDAPNGENGARALLPDGDGELLRDGVRVELHGTMLQDTFALPIETMCWQGLGRASLLGRSVPSLAPEDLLLVLCGHGARNGWERLIWVNDVAALLARHREMDWDEVWRKAERLRGVRKVGLGLFLAGEWLGAGLPEEAARRMRADRAIPDLAARAVRSMMTEDEPFHAARKGAFARRTRDRASDRLRYRLARALPKRAKDRTSITPPDLLRVAMRAARVLVGHARRTGRPLARPKAQNPQLNPNRMPTPS